MRIIGIAGSSSRKSINKGLVVYASSLFEKADVNVIDLNDYEVDLFSEDKEKDRGIPNKINDLSNIIDSADLLVISLAEHNGSYSAAFKNVYDWLSRIPNRKVFGQRPVLLMASSPGGRGGQGVLSIAADRLPRDGSEVLATFSLPNFHNNFKNGEIADTTLDMELRKKVGTIKGETFKSFF